MSLTVHFFRRGDNSALSPSGLDGVLGPLMEPEDALTVSGVMSNARGVVMVRWVWKTNPVMIKQFIYIHLQRCISASDNKHVNVIDYDPDSNRGHLRSGWLFFPFSSSSFCRYSFSFLYPSPPPFHHILGQLALLSTINHVAAIFFCFELYIIDY